VQYHRAKIVRLLLAHFEDDDRRIEHALKVFFHAERVAAERDDCDADVLAACALLHDVGIKPSEAELGYNDGRTQERYGPPIAEELLQSIGFSPEKTQKVAEIIGNHHSKSRYDYAELEVLKAADRIVNLEENASSRGTC